MSERRSDSWVSVLMSVLVHGALIALLGWSWWYFRRPAPAARMLAIEARVVDGAALARLTAPAQPQPQSPAPPPSPPQPAPQSAPQPPSEQTQQRRAEQERAERARAEQAEQERRAARAEQAEQERRAARAEAERKAREAAQKQAAARAEQARLQAEAERQRREAELRAQMATEERVNAARGSAQQAEYKALIEARINRAWIRPATAHAGINCEVRVTQVPGGEVVGVQVTRCNGDAAVRESIEAAVYRASPLPQPPNPDLFDRNLVVTFAPDD
jgi:colicin import membrane protein